MLLLFQASKAEALEVLLARPGAQDEALKEAFYRLRAELVLQGFEVRVVDFSGAHSSADALESEAQRLNAFAAIAFEREDEEGTAKLQIVDRVTGKTLTRRLKFSDDKDGALLLAIRASELLRASLAEFEPGEAPPEDLLDSEHQPAAKEVVQFARELARFQIEAGAVLLYHPRWGAGFGGSLGFQYRAHSRVLLQLALLGPAFGQSASANDNQGQPARARLRSESALALVALNLGAVQPGLHLEAGPKLGLGVTHLQAVGEVEPPLVAESAGAFCFTLAGGAFLELYFNQTLSLKSEVLALGYFPQPLVEVGGREAFSWPVSLSGRLLLGVSF